MVQGVLAPIQFLACAISIGLVLYYLATGEGYVAATVSIIVKTGLLYTIMVTGAIWEKVVFDQYLLAPGFFWEDMVSFAVIAIHTAYLWALWAGIDPATQMYIALTAYVLYIINAAQFIWKLRVARLEGRA
jgi:3-vinyl bacteriochlorophyllide hydratase